MPVRQALRLYHCGRVEGLRKPQDKPADKPQNSLALPPHASSCSGASRSPIRSDGRSTRRNVVKSKPGKTPPQATSAGATSQANGVHKDPVVLQPERVITQQFWRPPRQGPRPVHRLLCRAPRMYYPVRVRKDQTKREKPWLTWMTRLTQSPKLTLELKLMNLVG